ncbi:MAG: hypothetical protein Q7R39_06260 [Dehalococcoidia bacterium]|nr:hypothetical protein [Dehalococcoidia bacterium]
MVHQAVSRAKYAATRFVIVVLVAPTAPTGGSCLPSRVFSFRTLIDSGFSGGAVTNTVQVSSGFITTSALARTDVRRWTFLPVLTKGATGW